MSHIPSQAASPESPLARRERRCELAERELFDLLIVGGGVHGVFAARQAAASGLRTLLLEGHDYGFGTSSRSSKMLHGGVRYLETGDIRLVYEALREREYLLEIAGPLARRQSFLFPAIRGLTRPAWQLGLGLSLYDLLARLRTGPPVSFPRHARLSADTPEAQQLRARGLRFDALFRYWDGQMDDARICVEAAIDAGELGAVALNHAEVVSLRRYGAGRERRWTARWRCALTGRERQSESRFVLNYAGARAASLLAGAEEGPELQIGELMVLSRGSHLMFRVPWKLPGLILPTGTAKRYYFVWPYFGDDNVTLVGTTDGYTEHTGDDPQPRAEEVDELLSFLKRDLPNAGLAPETMYQAFCGVRVLARDTHSQRMASFASTSREHLYIAGEGSLTLLGGKYTAARATAAEAVSLVLRDLERASPPVVAARALPAGRDWSEAMARDSAAQLETVLRDKGFSAGDAQQAAQGALSRFGARTGAVTELAVTVDEERAWPDCLRAEIRYTILHEEACTVEDILRRRLGLALLPGGGQGALAAVCEELVSVLGRPQSEVDAEAASYRSRWCALNG